MEDEDDHKELQLLPAPTEPSPPPQPPSSTHPRQFVRYNGHRQRSSKLGLVDLQLSISVRPRVELEETNDEEDGGRGGVAALKWEAAEQIRMAAMEKAYAERVRELTRREMELAQSEFARARHVWERAREEVERAERMKERAIAAAAVAGAAVNPSAASCMEITCQSCRQRFRPN